MYLTGDVLATGCVWLAHASNFLDILARGGRRGMEHELHTPMTPPQSSTRERRALRLLPSVAYLLNIWILGPVAPLTGQYSCRGLN